MLDYSHEWKNVSHKMKHLPVSVETDDWVLFTNEWLMLTQAEPTQWITDKMALLANANKVSLQKCIHTCTHAGRYVFQ